LGFHYRQGCRPPDIFEIVTEHFIRTVTSNAAICHETSRMPVSAPGTFRAQGLIPNPAGAPRRDDEIDLTAAAL
jgi:hypothetical protein